MPVIDKQDINYIYYYVGKNVAKQRKLKGWSQSKLANACNFTTAFISNIENNAPQTFSLATLYLIARELEVPIKEFFNEID